jgi:O-antigen/teichoic acid export membrane protein
MSNLVKNTTIYAIGDIAPRLLGFISFPILTQFLTPAEYGIVNYVNTVNTFLTIVGFLCLNTYYLVYYNRFIYKKQAICIKK